MIKRLLTLAAAVAALSFGAAADTLPLTLDNLNTWDATTYDPATKTITCTEAWKGGGWWLEDVDYSAYDEVVVETADNTVGYRIVVEYVNSNNASEVDVPVDRLKGICPLNEEFKDHVKQIYIQLKQAGSLTLKDAYLQNSVVVDPSVPVVLWEGEKAIDWWSNAVDLVPADFITAHAVAGDFLKLEYTASENNGFKIVAVDKDWNNDIIAGWNEVPGFNEEYKTINLPTDGTLDIEINEAMAEVLVDAAVYQTFKFCGEGVTMKKITLVHAEAEEPVSDWKSLVIGGDATSTSESFISTPSYGPAPTAEIAGKTAYYTEIPADCANDYSSQFFIHASETLVAGDKIHVSFDYYCTDSRDINTQWQAAVGDYVYWKCLGTLKAKSEWQSFDQELDITDEMTPADKNPLQTIAFNLGTDPAAATFYITNIKLEKYDAGQGGFTEIAVDDNNDAPVEYFNLQGVRVANPESGLYIRRQGTKTTKVIIK